MKVGHQSINDLEAVVLPFRADVAALVERLGATGARAVRMTGSGAAVFGLYDDVAAARAALVGSSLDRRRAHAGSFVARGEAVSAPQVEE